MDPSEKTIPRRDFMRAAVAIGGMSALSACMDRTQSDGDGNGGGGGPGGEGEPKFPRGPEDLSTLPEEQHKWGKYVVKDPRGSPVFPQHQVVLNFEYVGEFPPTEAEREQVESAFRTLERAYQRGTGGNRSNVINRGLLFQFGYSPSYFQRYDESLPSSVELHCPEAVLDALGDDTGKARNYDAAMLFGSDEAEIVLSVEEMLKGNLDTINGVEVEGTFEGVFEVADRVAGFIGRGLPHEKINDTIPEESPLSMGFKSAFPDALPSEDKMTIEEGPFAGGTTQILSRLELDLESWYDHDHASRINAMYGPDYDEEDVGVVGDMLGGDSGITEEKVAKLEDDAREKGVVGHSQKTAQARDDDFDPVILRRGEFLQDNGDGNALMNFGAVHRGTSDFIETRKAMQRIGPEDGDQPEVDPDKDGIVNYITVVERTTFLDPPRSQRALPTPTGVP
ncbi:MAG: hypothetical protein ABEJ04_03425 [Halobacteriaceae archaeon]